MVDCTGMAALARLPKGTLPERHMTARSRGYQPERVVVSRHGYQPFGSDMLRDKKPELVTEFFSHTNRKLIMDKTLEALRREQRRDIKTEDVPGHILDIAMHKAMEIFGNSQPNAPAAQVGPSESLPWQARDEKYTTPVIDFGSFTHEGLAQMNHAAARFLRETIISEMALLSRYHAELGGAIHVLEYPQAPPPELDNKHQLINRYYDDVSSAPYTGISGNRLLPNRVIDSQRLGPNIQSPPRSPLAQHVGWSDAEANMYTGRLPGTRQ